MTKLSALERIIAKLLVDSAINRSGNFSYSELSDILEKQYKYKVNAHFGLAKPLGNVARVCKELGLPLLSVRVQYNNDTTGRTAKGFYAIACELKPEYASMEPTSVRIKELKLTRECADWKPLLRYLGEDTPAHTVAERTEKTIAEQFDEYAIEIIKKFGTGHKVQLQEIVNALVFKYGTNPNSILPADFCYNRWNKGIDADGTAFFEYINRGEYRVWGKNYSFHGTVYANPINGKEHIVGYCVDGRRCIGKLPVFPDEVEEQSEEYREGKKAVVQINTYERNPEAREACIKHYGPKCSICGMDFGEFYGPECAGLIHVHHLKMISLTKGEHQIDPIRDLRPVCPNCHMVLHSKPEGYSVDEVRKMVEHFGRGHS